MHVCACVCTLDRSTGTQVRSSHPHPPLPAQVHPVPIHPGKILPITADTAPQIQLWCWHCAPYKCSYYYYYTNVNPHCINIYSLTVPNYQSWCIILQCRGKRIKKSCWQILFCHRRHNNRSSIVVCAYISAFLWHPAGVPQSPATSVSIQRACRGIPGVPVIPGPVAYSSLT